jgi:hypothetical protein
VNGLNTSFSHHFFGAEGIGAVLVLGLAVWLGQGGLAEVRRGERLVAAGVFATGEVTGKTEGSATTSSSMSRMVYYRFTPDGSTVAIEGRQKVGRQMYIQARAGQARRVFYLPGDPGVNEIDPGVTRVNGWRNAALGGVAGLVALVLGGLAWRKARASRARYRDGTVVQARIVAHEPAGATKEGKPTFAPVWRDDLGREGRLAAGVEGMIPVVGLAVKVLVDPAGRFPPERIWP